MSEWVCRRSRAWLLLTAALAVHVIDEAWFDFLSFYNPWAQTLRQEAGLPLPVFSFPMWLGLLMVALLGLFFLGAFAHRDYPWIHPVAYWYSIIMLANGVLHLLASAYYVKMIPGLFSAPLITVAAVWLLHLELRRPTPSALLSK